MQVRATVQRTTGAFCGRGRGADIGAAAGADAGDVWCGCGCRCGRGRSTNMGAGVDADAGDVWCRCGCRRRCGSECRRGRERWCGRGRECRRRCERRLAKMLFARVRVRRDAAMLSRGRRRFAMPPCRVFVASICRPARNSTPALGIAWLARYTGRNALLAGKGWWGAGVFSLRFCR